MINLIQDQYLKHIEIHLAVKQEIEASNLFGRKSFHKKAHEIKINKIRVFSNIFTYLLEVKKVLKNKEAKFLIISISPYR